MFVNLPFYGKFCKKCVESDLIMHTPSASNLLLKFSLLYLFIIFTVLNLQLLPYILPLSIY